MISCSWRYNSSYESVNDAIDDSYRNARNVVGLPVSHQVTDNFKLKGTAKSVFGDSTLAAAGIKL